MQHLEVYIILRIEEYEITSIVLILAIFIVLKPITKVTACATVGAPVPHHVRQSTRLPDRPPVEI